MNIDILQFKLNKLRRIAADQGMRNAFLFLIGKAKKWVHNTFFYRSFEKSIRLTPEDIKKARATIQTFSYKPLISIVMPVYNVEEKWLRLAIESVRNQVYENWELCIADDASSKAHIREVLEAYARMDPRIKVVFRSESGNISEASNSALSIATGSFIALLDHDDEYACDALYMVVKALQEHQEADVLYSDEDKIGEDGKHFDAWFKPDWSPEYILSHMYVCHLSVYRTSLVRELGGFRKEYDGAQDYDLLLRASEKAKQIVHIPKILYHWRAIHSSTAHNPLAKAYAYEAGRKAVDGHLERLGISADVVQTQYYGVYKANWRFSQQPLVSIIIPSAGKQAVIKQQQLCLLENCIDSILNKSTWRSIEIVVVDGCDLAESTIAFLNKHQIKRVSCSEPFNFSQRINMGVNASSGDVLLLLNDDTEIVTENWIEEMLGLAIQRNIGAVGAKLITADNRVQHAGVILIEGSPGHIYYGVPNVGQGYFNALCSYKNYLAVTGACLMVERKKYDLVGGMDEFFPVNYNDVDFCLKLYESGLRNVYNGHVELFHFESISREKGFKPEELEKMISKWRHLKEASEDPYYNETLVRYPALLR